jgi:uncharacterized membrane protein YdjX (TVP38/TMEM64 family)
MEPPPESGRSLWPRLALLALLLLGVAAFYALGLNCYLSWESVRDNVGAWQERVEEYLALSLALFFCAYVSVTALSLPVGALLALVAGALFGRWLGTGVVSLASTLGATLAFLSSRYLFRDWVQRRFASRLGPINRGVARDGAYYLFTLRLLPVVPFFLINLGMGLTPMCAGTFAAVSWAGMLLGTFLYVNVGTELATLSSPADVLSWKVLGALALLGVAPLVLRLVLRGAGGGAAR